MDKENSKLNKLQQLNPSLDIIDIKDSSFSKYGKILKLKSESKLIKKLDKDTIIPETGNVYKASIKDWEEKDILEELSTYYNEKVEIGYCIGNNVKLNALEWHDCDEIDVFSTDALLFLAKLDDLNEYKLNSDDIKAFFVEKGTSVLLYKDTLHFSPCKTEEAGFKSIIILTDQTNVDLSDKDLSTIKQSKAYKDSLIFKKNKYIICHEEADHLTKQGVKPNIFGENFTLQI